jgi:hypothetical protein
VVQGSVGYSKKADVIFNLVRVGLGHLGDPLSMKLRDRLRLRHLRRRVDGRQSSPAQENDVIKHLTFSVTFPTGKRSAETTIFTLD